MASACGYGGYGGYGCWQKAARGRAGCEGQRRCLQEARRSQAPGQSAAQRRQRSTERGDVGKAPHSQKACRKQPHRTRRVGSERSRQRGLRGTASAAGAAGAGCVQRRREAKVSLPEGQRKRQRRRAGLRSAPGPRAEAQRPSGPASGRAAASFAIRSSPQTPADADPTLSFLVNPSGFAIYNLTATLIAAAGEREETCSSPVALGLAWLVYQCG